MPLGPEHFLQQAIDLSRLLTATLGIQWVDGVWFENIGDPDLEPVPCMTTEPFNATYSSQLCQWERPSGRDGLEAFIHQHWITDKSLWSTWRVRSGEATDETDETDETDADWPMITAAVIKEVMWREKMPV